MNKSFIGVMAGMVGGIAIAVGGFFLYQYAVQTGQPTQDTSLIGEENFQSALAHNIGIIGVAPSIYKDQIVFFTYEESAGSDLNGDGDLRDNVLRVYDLASASLRSLPFQGVEPVLYEGKLVFHTSENKAQKDLNGDGDMKDTVIRLYDETREAMTDTVITGGFPDIDGNIVAFHVFERWVDQDLNGDGDVEDMVIQFYDLETDTLTNTGIEGARASISGDLIAFHTFEFLSKQDFNGDGDDDDVLIRLYNIRTAELIDPHLLGKHPNLVGQRLVFESNESALAQDFNQDGDLLDNVVRLYDLRAKTFEAVILMGTFPEFDGELLVYSALESQLNEDLTGDGDLDDSVIQLYDLTSKTHTQTGIAGTSPSLYRDKIAFYTHESWVNQDLNGDGLISDYVIQFYEIGR